MRSRTVIRGLITGIAGVAAMKTIEKVEQRLTHRPDSYVPARTLARLLGRRPEWHDHDRALNWMHRGQGIPLGAVRAVMAEHEFRGPVGSFLFLNLRLLNDQTLENATGVGSPPWTWPVDEQAIDLVHKGVYAFATGAVADRLIRSPKGTPRPRRPWNPR